MSTSRAPLIPRSLDKIITECDLQTVQCNAKVLDSQSNISTSGESTAIINGRPFKVKK